MKKKVMHNKMLVIGTMKYIATAYMADNANGFPISGCLRLPTITAVSGSQPDFPEAVGQHAKMTVLP